MVQLRVSNVVVVISLGLQSSEVLTEAGRSLCKIAHSHGWQAGTGKMIPLGIGLPRGLFDMLHNTIAGVPQN